MDASFILALMMALLGIIYHLNKAQKTAEKALKLAQEALEQAEHEKWVERMKEGYERM